jgi:hypothetical protein|tara:strand:- start:345 stop:548 length:204 start_codon:yes stop_codon:yes gene_type:complete
MNEDALIKIQSIVIGLDRELYKYTKELITGNSLLEDRHLIIMVEGIERELNLYTYILNLIINDINVN